MKSVNVNQRLPIAPVALPKANTASDFAASPFASVINASSAGRPKPTTVNVPTVLKKSTKPDAPIQIADAPFTKAHKKPDAPSAEVRKKPDSTWRDSVAQSHRSVLAIRSNIISSASAFGDGGDSLPANLTISGSVPVGPAPVLGYVSTQASPSYVSFPTAYTTPITEWESWPYTAAGIGFDGTNAYIVQPGVYSIQFSITVDASGFDVVAPHDTLGYSIYFNGAPVGNQVGPWYPSNGEFCHLALTVDFLAETTIQIFRIAISGEGSSPTFKESNPQLVITQLYAH